MTAGSPWTDQLEIYKLIQTMTMTCKIQIVIDDIQEKHMEKQRFCVSTVGIYSGLSVRSQKHFYTYDSENVLIRVV